MPRNRKQKKTKQKKAKKDLNLDVRVIPRNKDAGVRRFEPEAEEWQLDNAQPKSSRVRCHSEKVPKTADGLSECMHDIMMRKLKKVEVELETNLSDTVEQLSSQFDELRAGIRQLNARIEVVALNMVSGLSFERTWSDEQNAFRAILARMLLDRSRRTAAEALGLSKWEDIREKGDAHVQIAFFKQQPNGLGHAAEQG
ncbi:hypothetical protein BD410DRAFT_826524 [Rickenella mellea]|uniref:Uncharacterized protein n=1 Tax=Rickenella mellea TaxID=50990 RepID=A0A4Y7QCY3_9AGAM|nr:hypothetical protein BD410DRAFT_826524 [Rickenella mellea]